MKKDDVQNMIEKFVDQERSTGPNPFLSTRVMTKITSPVIENTILHPSLKFALVVGGLVSAVAGGVALGSTYSTRTNNETVLCINDTQIENFGFYYTIGEE